jgi:hypothetical protein
MKKHFLETNIENDNHLAKYRKTLELKNKLIMKGNLSKMIGLLLMFDDIDKTILTEILFDLFVYNDWTYDKVKEQIESLCK